jgi:hypothetical protein
MRPNASNMSEYGRLIGLEGATSWYYFRVAVDSLAMPDDGLAPCRQMQGQRRKLLIVVCPVSM